MGQAYTLDTKSQTEKVAENVVKKVSEVPINVMQGQKWQTLAEEGLFINPSGGDVVLDNFSQNESVTVDMKTMVDEMAQPQMQLDLQQTLEKVTKASVSGIPFGNMSSVMNKIDEFLEVTINQTTNIAQNCSAILTTEQNVFLSTDGGHVYVKDSSQTSIEDLFGSCMLTVLSTNGAVANFQDAQDVGAVGKLTNTQIWALIITLSILFPLSLILPAVLAHKSKNWRLGFDVVFSVMLAFGVIVTLIFFIDQHQELYVIQYTQGIQSDPNCGGVVVGDVSTKFATPNDARDEMEAQGYAAFDWIGWDVDDDGVATQKKLPETTFYSSVKQMPCQNIEADGSSFYQIPTFTAALVAPTDPAPQINDFWVNPTDGVTYLFDGSDWNAFATGWVDVNTEGIVGFFNRPPTGFDDPIGYSFWFNKVDSSLIHKYAPVDGEWVQMDDVVGVSPVIGVPKYTLDDGSSIPLANTTAYNYSTYKQWMLVLGPSLAFIASLGLVLTHET